MGTTGNELNFIKSGELASNLADHSLWGFDGTDVFEYGSNSFLNQTGGTISGDLEVSGSISANTFFSGSTELSEIIDNQINIALSAVTGSYFDAYDSVGGTTSISRKVVDEKGNIIHYGEHPVVYSDYYADGGFKEHMPISKAIEDGATEIDAISTNTEEYAGDMNPEFGANPLKLLSRMFDISLREAIERDIDNAKNMAKDKDVTLKIYYAPRHLTDNSMYFNKEQMSGWWQEGYEYMEHNHEHNKECCKVIKLKARKTIRKK
jgi:hypothetical protein